MHCIYLSPHLDDAILSCGGMIWEQTQREDHVEIWTVCAGDPPKGYPLADVARNLHTRWGTGNEAVKIRRGEDAEACRRVGASCRHLDTPDAIYRWNTEKGIPLVQVEDDIFQRLPAWETRRVRSLAQEIKDLLPPGSNLIVPLAMGGHVDHQLTRAVAEAMDCPIWFFADYPYIVDFKLDVKDFLPLSAQKMDQPVSSEGLNAWIHAIAAYQSQLSTFWKTDHEMVDALAAYLNQGGGTALWKTK